MRLCNATCSATAATIAAGTTNAAPHQSQATCIGFKPETIHGLQSDCSCSAADKSPWASRRGFVQLLGSMGALGAASALPGCMTMAARPDIVDTHHHFYPPAYQKAWLDWEDQRKIPHFPQQVGWSVQKALADMGTGQTLKVVATDAGSTRDFQAFAKQTGNELIHQETLGNEFIHVMRRR